VLLIPITAMMTLVILMRPCTEFKNLEVAKEDILTGGT
jgi:hypothetical protein